MSSRTRTKISTSFSANISYCSWTTSFFFLAMANFQSHPDQNFKPYQIQNSSRTRSKLSSHTKFKILNRTKFKISSRTLGSKFQVVPNSKFQVVPNSTALPASTITPPLSLSLSPLISIMQNMQKVDAKQIEFQFSIIFANLQKSQGSGFYQLIPSHGTLSIRPDVCWSGRLQR